MTDLNDAALVLFAICAGIGIAGIANFIAKRRQRRKWRDARKRFPYILD